MAPFFIFSSSSAIFAYKNAAYFFLPVLFLQTSKKCCVQQRNKVEKNDKQSYDMQVEFCSRAIEKKIPRTSRCCKMRKKSATKGTKKEDLKKI